MRSNREIVIERFDIRGLSDDALRELHGLEELLRSEEEPDDPPRPFSDYAASVRSMPTFFEIEGFLARDESGGVAGAAEATFLLTSENSHLCQVSLFVRPDMRRRGIGRELLSHVVGVASSKGRTLLVGATTDRIPSGEEFARCFGAEPGNTSRVSRLVLSAVDRSIVDDWVAQGPTRAPGYSLVQVDGRCPDDLVEQVVDLFDVMNDAPVGELQVEDRHLTVEQFRDMENQSESVGRKQWLILAKHDQSGELVGLSEVTWKPSVPDTIHQGDTGVRATHRGHAIGKWMKAVMLRRMLNERAQVVDVRTRNADSNAAMLGINDALGFKPYIAQTVWQAQIERLNALDR